MQTTRPQSKIKKIFGLVIGSSFAIGFIGLGVLLVSGFHSTQLYFNSLELFLVLLAIGVIGARIYGIVWGKK